MLAVIGRLVALAIFVGSGWYVMQVITTRPEAVAEEGGSLTLMLWRPLIWTVAILLVIGIVRWLRKGRQAQSIIIAILVIVVAVLLIREFAPDAMSGVWNLLIPAEVWVVWFTLALAAFVALAVLYVTGIGTRVPRRLISRGAKTNQEGADLRAVA